MAETPIRMERRYRMSAPIQPDAPESEDAPDAAAAEQPVESIRTEDGEIDWKAAARKHEKDAKAARKALADAQPALGEYQKMIDANRSESERLTEQAKREAERAVAAEARAQALLERTAAAEARAALAGIPGAESLIEELNLSRFIEDGEIDSAAIAGLRTKFAAFAPQGARAMQPNPAQGAQPAQLDPSQVAAEYLRNGDVKSSVTVKAAQVLAARQAAGN